MEKQPGCPYDTYIFDVDKAEELEGRNFVEGERVHLVYNPSRRTYRNDEFLLPNGSIAQDDRIDMWHITEYVVTAISRGYVYLGVGVIHRRN